MNFKTLFELIFKKVFLYQVELNDHCIIWLSWDGIRACHNKHGFFFKDDHLSSQPCHNGAASAISVLWTELISAVDIVMIMQYW